MYKYKHENIQWLHNRTYRLTDLSTYEAKFIEILQSLYDTPTSSLSTSTFSDSPALDLLQYKSILINHYLDHRIPLNKLCFHYKPFIASFIDYYNTKVKYNSHDKSLSEQVSSRPLLYLSPLYSEHFWTLTNKLVSNYNSNHDSSSSSSSSGSGKSIGGGGEGDNSRYLQFQFPFVPNNNEYNHKMASIIKSFMLFMPNWLFYGYPMEYWYTITYSIMMKQFLTNQNEFGCIRFTDDLINKKKRKKKVIETTTKDKDDKPPSIIIKGDKRTTFALFPFIYSQARKEIRIEERNIDAFTRGKAIFSPASNDIFVNLIRLRRILSFPSRNVESIIRYFVMQALIAFNVFDKKTDKIIFKPIDQLSSSIQFNIEKAIGDALIYNSIVKYLTNTLPFYCTFRSFEEKGPTFFVTLNKEGNLWRVNYRLYHISTNHHASWFVVRPIPLIYRKVIDLVSSSSKNYKYPYTLNLQKMEAKKRNNALSETENIRRERENIEEEIRRTRSLNPNKIYYIFPQQIEYINTRLKAFIDSIVENDIRPSDALKELVTFAIRRRFQSKFSSFFRYLTYTTNTMDRNDEYIQRNTNVKKDNRIDASFDMLISSNSTTIRLVFTSFKISSKESDDSIETDKMFLLYEQTLLPNEA